MCSWVLSSHWVSAPRSHDCSSSASMIYPQGRIHSNRWWGYIHPCTEVSSLRSPRITSQSHMLDQLCSLGSRLWSGGGDRRERGSGGKVGRRGEEAEKGAEGVRSGEERGEALISPLPICSRVPKAQSQKTDCLMGTQPVSVAHIQQLKKTKNFLYIINLAILITNSNHLFMYTITLSGRKFLFSYFPIFVIWKFSRWWLLLVSLLLKFRCNRVSGLSVYKISHAAPWPWIRTALTDVN